MKIHLEYSIEELLTEDRAEDRHKPFNGKELYDIVLFE